MPQLRLMVLRDVADNPDSPVIQIRRRLQKPRATVDRALQALHMLGLLVCREEEVERGGRMVQERHYRLVDGVSLDPLTVPEMSVPPTKPPTPPFDSSNHTYTDKSGTGGSAPQPEPTSASIGDPGVHDVEVEKVVRRIEALNDSDADFPAHAGGATESASYKVLGPAPPGWRCDLCGSGIGVKRIKHGSQMHTSHPVCFNRFLANLADPPVNMPEQPPDA